MFALSGNLLYLGRPEVHFRTKFEGNNLFWRENYYHGASEGTEGHYIGKTSVPLQPYLVIPGLSFKRRFGCNRLRYHVWKKNLSWCLCRYLGSLYWAVETLTSPQFGNEAPRTRWELAAATARIGLFMAYDIAIGAYIMGTISLLVVKADERTGDFRDRAANLKQFVQQHAIPKVVHASLTRLYMFRKYATPSMLLCCPNAVLLPTSPAVFSVGALGSPQVLPTG
jgi:hypothetical protein